MPFCKRTIVPKYVCKDDPKTQGIVFTDLVDVCGFALRSVLRQLSDLSRQSVSILEELEGELVSICHRSGTLESKVINLQRHVLALATKPPPTTTTNLDLESKRAGHFRLSWQQHVNVLGLWSRPECVRELHQEAELNLHSLLREFGEQLYDHEVPEQTLGPAPSQSSEVCVDETASGGISCEDSPGSTKARPLPGPPVPEKPHWYLRRYGPAHLRPTGFTADGILAVDLIPGALGPRPFPRSPLRKACSDLQLGLHPSRGGGADMMENVTLGCPSSSWNGPRGSTFSPVWDDSFNSFLLSTAPIATATAASSRHASQGSLGSHSLASVSMEMMAEPHSSAAVAAGDRRESQGADHSLSTPTDSDSLSSAERASSRATPAQDGERHALSYPSGSSEDGASPRSAAVSTAMDLPGDGRPRARSRSISLRKPKKKPVPPVRSVSLLKNGHAHRRPKSLCIPREQPDLVLSASPALLPHPGGAGAAGHHRSLSCSSAALGMAALGSSESLTSPSSSRHDSPSQLSPEAESKPRPLKPGTLVSPSSGYSSLSDTPTSLITGPSPLGCRMRPKIPERKSSLPPAMARERAARARLSCELPLASHPDPTPPKPQPKHSRRHSDSSRLSQPIMPLVTESDLRSIRLRSVGLPEPNDAAEKPPGISQERPSPAPNANPRPKPPIAAKPQISKRPLSLTISMPTPASAPVPAPGPAPDPSPAPATSSPPTSPTSPTPWPLPPGSMYKVMRKPKSRKGPAPAPPDPGAAEESAQQQQQESERQQGAGFGDPPRSSGSEAQGTSRTLPSRITISCLAELDRRQKVKPPVPRKPNILLLPVDGVHGDATPDLPPDSEPAQEGGEPGAQPHLETPAPRAEPEDGRAEGRSSEQERSTSCAPEDDDYDDVFDNNSTPHTTEDLFTIIHRSKRRVLGREPPDSFGSRQSLASPVKSEGDPRARTLSAGRSSSRNNNFLALLQRRGSKSSPGGRVSAMELLRNTNPLARRVSDFSHSDCDSDRGSNPPPQL
ncbi:NHS-like protein 2 [Megalops cyprinoides]|uniref:NHS-like protein 2 n=1 Tax=Megalops cyprinoides TaxID=118141 RepID=UPI001864E148|nr:NHS-like protein 2 [Megalops cyprinoides]